jgi:hypothetical protein
LQLLRKLTNKYNSDELKESKNENRILLKKIGSLREISKTLEINNQGQRKRQMTNLIK